MPLGDAQGRCFTSLHHHAPGQPEQGSLAAGDGTGIWMQRTERPVERPICLVEGHEGHGADALVRRGGRRREARIGVDVLDEERGQHTGAQVLAIHPAERQGRTAALGQQASQALTSILGVVGETHLQAAAITVAVRRMTEGVAAVETASAHVATVATETAQAAGQMRQGALRVQGSVESISAVGEQSAAGAEEVSASTEELSANAEEMSAGAQELSALATGLQEMVGRFTLEAIETTRPVGAKQNIRAIHAA